MDKRTLSETQYVGNGWEGKFVKSRPKVFSRRKIYCVPAVVVQLRAVRVVHAFAPMISKYLSGLAYQTIGYFFDQFAGLIP